MNTKQIARNNLRYFQFIIILSSFCRLSSKERSSAQEKYIHSQSKVFELFDQKDNSCREEKLLSRILSARAPYREKRLSIEEETGLSQRTFFVLVLSDFSDFLGCTEQATSCIDILSTTGTDGRKDSMRSEIITELFHFLIIDALQRDVRNLMETNQIETAVETLHQLDDCLGVLHTVVHSLEHDIFERQATLVREIIIAEATKIITYAN